MDQFILKVKDLAGNPFVTISGWIIGLLSFVLAIVFYLKSRKERRPYYAVRSNNIIKKAQQLLPGLSVRYSGHGDELSNFTVSTLAFWNAGRETIRKTDLVKADPITLKANENCILLGIETLYASPSNAFDCQLRRDKKSAELTFDYIDRHDGTVLQIAHTGLSNDDLTLTGKIKGGAEIIRLGTVVMRSRGDRMATATLHLVQACLMGAIGVHAFRDSSYAVSYFFFGMTIAYCFVSLKFFRPGVPKDLATTWHNTQ